MRKRKQRRKFGQLLSPLAIESILVVFDQTGGKLAKTAEISCYPVPRVRDVVTGEVGAEVRPDLPRVERFERGRPGVGEVRLENPLKEEAIRLRETGGLTLEEIGQRLGRTRERIRQLTKGVVSLVPIRKRSKGEKELSVEKRAQVERVLEIGQDLTLSAKEVCRRVEGSREWEVNRILRGLIRGDIRPELKRRGENYRVASHSKELEERRAQIYQWMVEEDLTIREMEGRGPYAFSKLMGDIFPRGRAGKKVCPCCRRQVRGKEGEGEGHTAECAVRIWQSRGRYRHHVGNQNRRGRFQENSSPEERREFGEWIRRERVELGLSLKELAGYLDQVGWEPSPCRAGSVSNYEKGMLRGKELLERRRGQFKRAFALALAREAKEK